ncbi:MAG: hypothetical protein ACRDP6_27530 [Actinoallomurus sp.]
MTMNDYHDRPADDPYQPAEDRPVAGWPGQNPDEHTDGGTDEHTDETPREGEPLVGEVADEEPAGEYDAADGSDLPGEHGRHERTDESVLAEADRPEESEAADPERVSEPFGTEEPIIVTEPEHAEAEHAEAEHAEAEPVAVAEPHEDAEPVAVAEPHEDAEPVAVAEPHEDAEPVVVAEPHEDAEPVAVEPVQAETEPEAEPVLEGARPTEGNDLTVENLLDAEAVARFHDRWREVKGSFVDDPSDAVRQASALSGEAVDELTAALARLRQNLDGHWDEGKETDTERLRVALRGYGSLIDHILTR